MSKRIIKIIGNFLRLFLMFKIRKNLDIRKIFAATKIFLKSRFVCTKFIFLPIAIDVI